MKKMSKKTLKQELEYADEQDRRTVLFVVSLFMVAINWICVSIIPLYWLYETLKAKFPFISRWELFQWMLGASVISLGCGIVSIILIVGVCVEEGKRIADIKTDMMD